LVTALSPALIEFDEVGKRIVLPQLSGVYHSPLFPLCRHRMIGLQMDGVAVLVQPHRYVEQGTVEYRQIRKQRRIATDLLGQVVHIRWMDDKRAGFALVHLDIAGMPSSTNGQIPQASFFLFM
jgi:hypothetical protein